MTVTLPLPLEVEIEAKNIPDLQDRLMSFVRHQVDLEQWRARRYSDKTRELVKNAARLASRDTEAGISREEAFEMFRAVHERISEQL